MGRAMDVFAFSTGELIPGSRYRVLRPLATGGMGEVYEVEDVSIGKRYVLKTLLGELAGDPDLEGRMRREARVMGRLSHPNVVRVFTAGATTGALRVPYIVMERLHGATLGDVLRAGPLSQRGAVTVAIDLLSALDHAHDVGVLHCDVKPDNVFLHRERSGEIVPKLLDFGVVHLLGAHRHTARFGGTVRYASPEQLRGDLLGPASDVYSTGLVLYEMLAGRGPFDDVVGRAAVTRAREKRDPGRIEGLGDELWGAVALATARSPRGRFRDAFAFGRALRLLLPSLHGAPVSVHAATAEATHAARTVRVDLGAPTRALAFADCPTRVADATERDVTVEVCTAEVALTAR